MIIACPACATRYVVPDSAVGVDGRTVRCAKCRHSWFQEGPIEQHVAAAAGPVFDDAVPPEAVPAPPPPQEDLAPPRDPRPGFAERILPEQRKVPVAPLARAAEPPADEAASPVPSAASPAPTDQYYQNADQPIEPPESFAAEPAAPAFEQPPEPVQDEYSQFDHEPPFRPRRNLLRLWTIAAAVFALVALGTVVAVSYWGLPDWVPISRPTFGLGQQDLVLDFPQNKQDRRQLPNGTEFFGASGSVTNVGSRTRSVPPILIVLRDARDRIVYTWEVAPPKRTIAPGETVTINEAVTDIPKAAKYAEFGWKPS